MQSPGHARREPQVAGNKGPSLCDPVLEVSILAPGSAGKVSNLRRPVRPSGESLEEPKDCWRGEWTVASVRILFLARHWTLVPFTARRGAGRIETAVCYPRRK